MSTKCISAVVKRTILICFTLLCYVSWAQTTHAKHLLVYGDSLSAAYGMDLERGWVHLLATHWADQHKVSNASISGETSAGGLARLPQTLAELKPDVVMIELGANDGLRGYSIDAMRSNLIKMIELVEASGATAVIVGVSLPPSYGPRYINEFRSTFKQIAEQRQLPFISIYRDSFFQQEGYIQQDGLHPTEITQPIILDLLLTFFEQEGLFN